MTRFIKFKKARRTHTCANIGTSAHDPLIRPGQTYARISDPPPYGSRRGGPWGYTILCAYCWDRECSMIPANESATA